MSKSWNKSHTNWHVMWHSKSSAKAFTQSPLPHEAYQGTISLPRTEKEDIDWDCIHNCKQENVFQNSSHRGRLYVQHHNHKWNGEVSAGQEALVSITFQAIVWSLLWDHCNTTRTLFECSHSYGRLCVILQIQQPVAYRDIPRLTVSIGNAFLLRSTWCTMIPYQ